MHVGLVVPPSWEVSQQLPTAQNWRVLPVAKWNQLAPAIMHESSHQCMQWLWSLSKQFTLWKASYTLEGIVVVCSRRVYNILIHLLNPGPTIVFVMELTVVGIVVKFKDSEGGNGSKREPQKYIRNLEQTSIWRLETTVWCWLDSIFVSRLSVDVLFEWIHNQNKRQILK